MIQTNYANEDDLSFLLVNSNDLEEDAYRFLQQYKIEYPCMLDTSSQLYDSYYRSSEAFAPYPVHVVIDRQSRIRYLAFQNDTQGVIAAINAALDDE